MRWVCDKFECASFFSSQLFDSHALYVVKCYSFLLYNLAMPFGFSLILFSLFQDLIFFSILWSEDSLMESKGRKVYQRRLCEYIVVASYEGTKLTG